MLPKFDFFLKWKTICSYRQIKLRYRLFKKSLLAVRLSNCLLYCASRRKKPKPPQKTPNPQTQNQDPPAPILQYLPLNLKKNTFPFLLGVLLTQSSFASSPTVSVPNNDIRQMNKMCHIGC